MRRTILITVSFLVVFSLAGCYERTTKARGVGAMGRSAQSGYRSDTAADRAVDSIFSDSRDSKPSPKNPGSAMPR
jgi:predicted small secreted protein